MVSIDFPYAGLHWEIAGGGGRNKCIETGSFTVVDHLLFQLDLLASVRKE